MHIHTFVYSRYVCVLVYARVHRLKSQLYAFDVHRSHRIARIPLKTAAPKIYVSSTPTMVSPPTQQPAVEEEEAREGDIVMETKAGAEEASEENVEENDEGDENDEEDCQDEWGGGDNDCSLDSANCYYDEGCYNNFSDHNYIDHVDDDVVAHSDDD